MQDLRNEFARMRNMKSPDPTPFITTGVLAALFLGFYACSMTSDLPEAKWEYCNDVVRHYTKAEMYIRGHLRDPSSAEFDSINDVQTAMTGPCEMTIVGKVRARNGFGGMALNAFSVTTRYDPETDTWWVGRLAME